MIHTKKNYAINFLYEPIYMISKHVANPKQKIVFRRPVKDANNLYTYFGMTGYQVASKHYSEQASTKESILEK
jgi:hypothetical protein